MDVHRNVRREDVAAWLPARPAWPAPSDRVRAALQRVLDDAALRDGIDAVLSAYDAMEPAADDRVLVHGDLGLHNLASSPRRTPCAASSTGTAPPGLTAITTSAT